MADQESLVRATRGLGLYLDSPGWPEMSSREGESELSHEAVSRLITQLQAASDSRLTETRIDENGSINAL